MVFPPLRIGTVRPDSERRRCGMRRGIMLGLAGVAVAQATAAAQFAADRGSPPPAAQTTPPPTPPTAPTTPPPAATAPAEQPASAHPWYVRPDLGPWMICVKSYSGPGSKALAEELAQHVRQA